jgi:tripartite ATP-independent transporter DctM subunit
MTLIVLFVTLFALLALGTPVGFAMGVSGVVGLLVFGGPQLAIGVLTTTPFSAVSSYELLTIPMFIMMAEMVILSEVADDLFRASAAWVGRVRGGLGMATALAGAGFGAICGTSTASAATLASTSLPSMIKHGYEPKMAAGVVAVSGTLAIPLPTSLGLIIYGILAQVSIRAMLMAGIVPAGVVTLTIMATIWLLVWQKPSRAPMVEAVPWAEKFRLLWRVAPVLGLFLIVTGAIYTGIATPIEASSLGAFGAFILAMVKARPGPMQFINALQKVATASCMILMIVLGAMIFGYAFILTQFTQVLVAWVGVLDVSRWVIMSILLCGYIVLGAFMDQLAILVLTVPIVLPLIKSLGFDPIWFGIIKTVTAEVGLITPPIGLNCYVVARYAKRPVIDVFHGVAPHFAAHIVAIAILTAFPILALWLPNHL